MEFKETHQLPVYADDDSILGRDIDTVKKNIETVL
jgi:hypothetical protein